MDITTGGHEGNFTTSSERVNTNTYPLYLGSSTEKGVPLATLAQTEAI